MLTAGIADVGSGLKGSRCIAVIATNAMTITMIMRIMRLRMRAKFSQIARHLYELGHTCHRSAEWLTLGHIDS